MIFRSFFVGGGYLAAEIFALFSLIGSGLLLFIAIINWIAKRRVIKVGNQLIIWSGINFFAGSLCVISLRLSDQFNPLAQSRIFEFHHTTIELILGLAFVMVFVSMGFRVTSRHYR